MTRGRVLVVDDEAHARAALRSLLGADGYDVRCAADALKALAALRSFDAHVVLTDLRMPVMDGLRFVEDARILRPGAVFVLMTGHGAAMRDADARSRGADYFLSKPLDTEMLFAVVQRGVERARRQAQTTRPPARETPSKAPKDGAGTPPGPGRGPFTGAPPGSGRQG